MNSVMSGVRLWALLVVAASIGCGKEEAPRDDCAELGADQQGVKTTGHLDAVYQGRFGTSPGRIEVIIGDPRQTGITVQGCGHASNGDLWRLVAVWDNLPLPDQLPANVGVYPKWEPFFWGELAVCYGGDCKSAFQSVFLIRNIGGFDEGSGVVTALDLANGHFAAKMKVLNGQGTPFPEPTTIDADLHWSPQTLPP